METSVELEAAQPRMKLTGLIARSVRGAKSQPGSAC